MIDRIKQSAAAILISLIILAAAVYVLANSFEPDDKGIITDTRGIISFESEQAGDPQPQPSMSLPTIDVSVDSAPSPVIREPTITQDHKTVLRYPQQPSPVATPVPTPTATPAPSATPSVTPIVNGSRTDPVPADDIAAILAGAGAERSNNGRARGRNR